MMESRSFFFSSFSSCLFFAEKQIPITKKILFLSSLGQFHQDVQDFLTHLILGKNWVISSQLEFLISFFLFGFFFCFCIKSFFKRFFFVFFSIFQIVLFYLFSFSLESNFMSLIAIPFIYIGLCISLLASPLAFIFAYLGEIILFIIVLYQAFPKNPKNHSKDSNPQPHSPKDS